MNGIVAVFDVVVDDLIILILLLDIWLHDDRHVLTLTNNNMNMARFFSTLILGAVLFASQNKGVEAFSPPSRSKVLNDLKEMRMTGAGGAAQPDSYNEGELSFTWNQG